MEALHGGKHLRIYDKEMKIDVHNPRRCELTGAFNTKLDPVEVTHIDASGMGGRDSVHNIENLVCLVRSAHTFFGDKTEFKDFLHDVHDYYRLTGTPYVEDHRFHPIVQLYLNKVKGVY